MKCTNKTIHKTYQNNIPLMNQCYFMSGKNIFVCAHDSIGFPGQFVILSTKFILRSFNLEDLGHAQPIRHSISFSQHSNLHWRQSNLNLCRSNLQKMQQVCTTVIQFSKEWWCDCATPLFQHSNSFRSILFITRWAFKFAYYSACRFYQSKFSIFTCCRIY